MFENVGNINWNNPYNLSSFILNLILILAIYGALFYLFVSVVKRRAAYIFLGVSLGLSLLTFLLGLDAAFILTTMFSTVGLFISVFSNFGSFRSFLANPFKRGYSKNGTKGEIGKVFDRQKLYDIITTSIGNLSRNKIGALITFEKQYSLSEICKNGVEVNCPVSPEILSTIFYPGTRLHDGAVVVKGMSIVYASVFFTPSTKAFAGKYGSRHRAAIGISEISDAVTVVVSEETGRISIAMNGQLETVSIDNFRRVFENYMSDQTISEE